MKRKRKHTKLMLCLAAILSAVAVSAFDVPEDTALNDRLMVIPDESILVMPSLDPYFHKNGNPVDRPGVLDFFGRYGSQWDLQWDLRSNRPDIVSGQGVPWVPGAGNDLLIQDILAGGEPVESIDVQTLELIARDFIESNRDLLRVDQTELVLNPLNSEGFGNHRIWLIHFDQFHDGVQVKNASVFFRVNAGNLTQFGAHRYASIPEELSAVPSVSAEQALEASISHAETAITGELEITQEPRLYWIQTFNSKEPKKPGEIFQGTPGTGYGYRLCWELKFRIDPFIETWFSVVDAQTGEILSFRDDNKYGAVSGGIYPITNINPEVVKPFPFATTSQGNANSGGRYNYTGGTASCTLNGQYVRINDNCGSINLSTSTDPGDLAFGGSSGTDCTTPGYGGSGNTHASRSCFYHINHIKFKARGYLPSNTWLQGNLTSNVNINSQCNAYWGGSSINFYRSGGGCSNTGEIASVFLHEYGHGLDYNTGTSSPDMASAEALADSMSSLQTHVSCIGHNFTPGSPCDFGCDSSCTGVRDVGVRPYVRPSNIHQAPANCDRWSCPYYGYDGIMGYEGHCEALIAGGAVWDAASKMAFLEGGNAGWALADRIFFETMGTASAAYQIQSGGTCNPSATINGCGSANWYTVWIFADDDNGNLADGTPHGCEIWTAFNDHGIACGTMPACYSTCPQINAPALTVAPGDDSATLNWPAVSNASSYIIYRNTLGCGYGMSIVGTTTGTQFVDSTVANDFTYFYAVQAIGSNDNCRSQFSQCIEIEITGCANPPGANAGSDQEGCPGDAFTLGGNPTGSSGTPPYSYLWSPGNYTSSNPVVYPNQTTTYTVLVTDAIGCVGMDTVTVSMDAPVVNAGFNQFVCAGYCVQIGSAPVQGYTYSWTPVTGLDDPTKANPIACVSATTTYTVVVTASGYLCEGQDSVIVTVAQPTIMPVLNQILSDSGDGDGMLEAGERATLRISVKNQTPMTAYNVTGHLTTLDPLIYLDSTERVFGDLNFNETASADFEIVVDAAHVCPGSAGLTLVLNACEAPITNQPVSIILGQPGGEQVIYSTGFETGDEGWTHAQVETQDDWQRDTPYGTSQYDPDSAYEGSICWGNDQGGSGWDGNYKNYVNNYLLSPVINCSGQYGVRMQFMRWLTIEQGIYDQATIYVNDQSVWQNDNNSDHIDTAWTPVDLDISAIADNNSNVRIKFELVSDGGVVFGGWNIDQFVVLADAPPECDRFDCSYPDANAGNDFSIPSGGQAVLNGSASTISGCVAGIEYRWSGGGLGGGTWSEDPVAVDYPATPTTYTLNIRCAGSPAESGCMDSDTVTVYMDGQATPTAPPPTATMPPPTHTPQPPTATFTPYPTVTPTPTAPPGEPTYTPVPPSNTPTSTPDIPSTPTSTPVDEPTATPTSGNTGIALSMILSKTMFHEGDRFALTTRTEYSGPDMMVDEYLLLDVYNNYWFYPDWTQDIDQVTRVVQSGVHDMEIFNFVWPMVDGSAEGIEFLYLMTAPDTYSLVSNLAIVEFGYE